MTRISAIIPAYNCEPWLRRAVESLLATGQAGLEIVIIDDGSTDDSFDAANQLALEHSTTVFVHHHPQHANLGVSATRNLGVERSRGELICFLDGDDFVYPHRFERAISILADRPDVDGVHELAEIVFESPEAAKQWWVNELNLFGFTDSIPPEELLWSLLGGRCWATSAVLVRKNLFERTGVFDPALSIAEDCHLWFRMAQSGKLVQGDLKRPVSAYWRHTRSAYRADPDNRLHMIRSMTMFRDWAARHGATADRMRRIEQSIHEYVNRGLTSARQSKQRGLAWKMAWQAVRQMPSLTFNRMFRGHLARMAIGR
ncbi:MAG: glycosyltransferase family 2 protein [Planctomycetia bacterium]|nr:glycosyltransferase family 2 protein [Planctomycetia bacterium]